MSPAEEKAQQSSQRLELYKALNKWSAIRMESGDYRMVRFYKCWKYNTKTNQIQYITVKG